MLLFLVAASSGCASSGPAASSNAGPPSSAASHAALTGNSFKIERNGFAKRVRFEDLETSRSVDMKYKGIPVAWGSPINLVIDEDVYERESHRVVYRFEHPLSARPMVLVARATSHRVGTVPVKPEDSRPVVRLFAGTDPDLQPRGTLRYDYESPVLFAGELGERRVEIERISKETALDRGVLKYFLFPFPVSGDFVIRVDGWRAAAFTQKRQHGFTSPYDLSLEGGLDEATRDDAMLAFVVFDLMKEFVNSAGS